MNLEYLKNLFLGHGTKALYAKALSVNDNSKNQIYFAAAVELLNVLPSKEIIAEGKGAKGPIFKAALNFDWLLDNGELAEAPGAQLIFYPQYPEVRFSGFLRGCPAGPSDLMADRERARKFSPELRHQLDNRVLFLGITNTNRIVGYVAAGNSEIVNEFSHRDFSPAFVVFREIPLPTIPDTAVRRDSLISELKRIKNLGWIDSKQLHSDGRIHPCEAPQCGGFTLEAELGIPKNSIAEPDFLGWEIKQHSVTSFLRPESSAAITLMTPEPTNGLYKEKGVEAFIRKYGYADKMGRIDRLNFGGIHRAGQRQASTGLRLDLVGYDPVRGEITDSDGAVALISDDGEIAASWGFAGILSHWSRKHSLAAYVPSMRRTDPTWQYSYGGKVRLAQRTNPLLLLAAVASGIVYYDPGIKLENASKVPVIKRRSQFRIASRNIASLYESVESVDL